MKSIIAAMLVMLSVAAFAQMQPVNGELAATFFLATCIPAVDTRRASRRWPAKTATSCAKRSQITDGIVEGRWLLCNDVGAWRQSRKSGCPSVFCGASRPPGT
jgi:hypothetical protein